MIRVMQQAHPQVVLFLAALLVPRKDLDWRVRSGILAEARSLTLQTRSDMFREPG